MTTESSYTNVILDIFAKHLRILGQKFLEFTPILQEIWDINHSKVDLEWCIWKEPEEGPRMVLDYISYLLQRRTVSLTVSYSGFGSYISGYYVVKFDFLGVLVSRDIGLQPPPSRPCIYFFRHTISQDIHFLGSLPPVRIPFWVHRTFQRIRVSTKLSIRDIASMIRTLVFLIPNLYQSSDVNNTMATRLFFKPASLSSGIIIEYV